MMDKEKLPAPRIQLRWQPSTGTGYQWECHYELVIALRKTDVRAEQYGPRGGRLPNLKELVVPIKPPSLRGSSQTPCTWSDGTRSYDAPYRDGAHAMWDAEQLGNPPIYVIAPDGMVFSKADYDARQSQPQQVAE